MQLVYIAKYSKIQLEGARLRKFISLLILELEEQVDRLSTCISLQRKILYLEIPDQAIFLLGLLRPSTLSIQGLRLHSGSLSTRIGYIEYVSLERRRIALQSLYAQYYYLLLLESLLGVSGFCSQQYRCSIDIQELQNSSIYSLEEFYILGFTIEPRTITFSIYFLDYRLAQQYILEQRYIIAKPQKDS